MISNLKLLPAALLVAVLALAGCGGGSDGTMTPTDPMPTPPTPDPAALATAVDAANDAEAASAMASMLLEDAVKASKALDAKSVNGSSQMAYENAMTVLNAGDLIEAERVKAAAAVAKAEGVDTTGMSEAEKARVSGLAEDAQMSLDEIVAIQEAEGADSLADAVMRVKTGRPIAETDAKSAQAKADAVAMAIRNYLLDATGAVQTIAPLTVGANAVAIAAAPDGAIMTTPNAGMTFAQITGGATKVATSIKDYNTADTTTAFTLPTGTDTTDIAVGTDLDANYMGIPGHLRCIVGTCSYDKDGKISGVVHFAPDSLTTLYSRLNYGDPYTASNNGAHYGHWLTDTALNVHARSLGATLDWDRNEGDGTTNTIDVEASYSGDASGYSARNTGTRAKPTYASGEFTATVNLDAVFGASDAFQSATLV